MNRISFILALICLLGIADQPSALASPFGLGNIVVVRIGDTGITAPGDNPMTVALDEFLPTGLQVSPVQTLTMPIATSGSVHALTLANNRQGGGLNLTANGRYLVLGGTDSAPKVPVTTDPTVRTIGRVDALGAIDTSTTFSNAYLGVAQIGIRSVASADGTSYYTGGNGTGTEVRYITHGSSASTAITSGPSRHVAIFGGNLYLAQDASMNQVGSGLPTSGPITPTLLPGVGGPPSGGNWNSPLFFDLSPSIAGPDTLYLGVQRSNSVELSAIIKFTYNGSTWSQAAAFDLDSLTGLLFLTGRVEGSDVVLYGTTDYTGAPAFGNKVVRMVDDGTPTFDILATSDSSHGFRGIAFAPVPEPSSVILIATGLVAFGLHFRRRRSKP